jgi:hypothetical protein
MAAQCLQDRPPKGLLADSYEARVQTEDYSHHSLWPLQVSEDAFWSSQCGQQSQWITHVLAGLPFMYCYLDDLRIASPDFKNHQLYLHLVFEGLHEFSLVINPEICVFAVASFASLSHLVSAQGDRSLAIYVEAFERRLSCPLLT